MGQVDCARGGQEFVWNRHCLGHTGIGRGQSEKHWLELRDSSCCAWHHPGDRESPGGLLFPLLWPTALPPTPDLLHTFLSSFQGEKCYTTIVRVLSKANSFKTKLHFRVDFTTRFCNRNADIILIMRENFSRMEMWWPRRLHLQILLTCKKRCLLEYFG